MTAFISTLAENREITGPAAGFTTAPVNHAAVLLAKNPVPSSRKPSSVSAPLTSVRLANQDNRTSLFAKILVSLTFTERKSSIWLVLLDKGGDINGQDKNNKLGPSQERK